MLLRDTESLSEHSRPTNLNNDGQAGIIMGLLCKLT